MALSYKAGNRILGLSTDEKPRTKVVEGSTFEEIDTGRRYFLRSSAWTENGQADNLYEQMHDYSSPAKQHIVEFFWDVSQAYGGTGNAQAMPPKSRWKAHQQSGTNTYVFGGANSDYGGCNDNGGLILSFAGADGNALSIGFNDIRPFDSKGSVFIGTMRGFGGGKPDFDLTANMGGIDDHDWSFDSGALVDHAMATLYGDPVNLDGFTYYSLKTGNSSYGGYAHTDFQIDHTWHTHKVECKSSTVEYSIDGYLASTEADNTIPAQTGFQPQFRGRCNDTGWSTVMCRYLEAYNT